jgi:hypothetical protein
VKKLNGSLQNLNDPDPNEEANLRGQNMRIKKTITKYPESGRTVVRTYDDDYNNNNKNSICSQQQQEW